MFNRIQTLLSISTFAATWRAKCKGKRLGDHATEEAAAQAYNIEAQRLGLPRNVILPAADADLDLPALGAQQGSEAAHADLDFLADEAQQVSDVAHDDDGSNPAAAAALARPSPAAPAHAHAGATSKRAASTSLASSRTKTMRPGDSAGAVGAWAAAAAALRRG